MIADSKILDALDDISNTVDDLPLDMIINTLFALAVGGQLGARRDSLAPLMRNLVTSRDANLTESMRKVIHAIILDDNESIARREACLALVLHTEAEDPESVFNRLNIDQRIELSGTWVRPMCKLAKSEPFPRYALTAMIMSTPEDKRLDMINKIAECAAQVDTELEGEVSIPNLMLKYAAEVIH
jgi:hypothetical protein